MTIKPRIEKRKVAGHHNPMAVCSTCDRDATQTRMTRYCTAAMGLHPVLCDECFERDQ